MKEVKVTWEDSNSYTNAWKSISDVTDLKLPIVETKGFLVFEDNTKVIIAQSRVKEEDGDVHNLMVIPMGSILETLIEGGN